MIEARIDQDDYLKSLLEHKRVNLKRSIVWGQEATLQGWRKASKAPSPFPCLFPAIDNLVELLKREAGQHIVSAEQVTLFSRTDAFWKQKVKVMTPNRELHAYFKDNKSNVLGRHGPTDDYEGRLHKKDRPSAGFKKKDFIKY